MRFIVAAISVFIAFLGGCAQDKDLRRIEFTRLEMGVRTRVVYYHPDEPLGLLQAADGAQAAFARIAELDACMSDYRSDSELMKLCASPVGVPVHVSQDLFTVLLATQRLSEASDGAFDVSAGPLVALWREARRTGELPTPAAIDEARGHVGWRSIVLDKHARTVTLTKPGMKLDLGGIAKGYAAQQAVIALRRAGLKKCLVALAGDICVGDAPPGEEGWTIAIGPHENAPVYFRNLLLKNACVSTSGDTEQFVQVAGARYSHIIDPRTGQAMTTSVQATVVSDRGEVADGLSTALSVLGPAQGVQLARKLKASAIIEAPGLPEAIVNGEHLRWVKP